MPDPRERLSRALGLAQSIVEAPDCATVDGVRKVAGEIATLLEAVFAAPSTTKGVGGEGEVQIEVGQVWRHHSTGDYEVLTKPLHGELLICGSEEGDTRRLREGYFRENFTPPGTEPRVTEGARHTSETSPVPTSTRTEPPSSGIASRVGGLRQGAGEDSEESEGARERGGMYPCGQR